MKTILFVLASAALASPSVFAASDSALPGSPATGPASPQTEPILAPPAMVLTITVPPSMHPFRDDDIANAIADNVLSEFRLDGFRGRIDYDFTSPNRTTTSSPRLDLSLVEWRITPTHFIECTFAANLVTAGGTQDLGLFTGTSMLTGWLRDPFTSGDDFDAAARSAIDDLYHALAQKKLLPDAITRA